MPRTTTLSVTRGDLIKASLRKLEVTGEGETPSPEDYTNCAFGLNIMLKSWEKDGYYLWKLSELVLPLVSGTSIYQIGPTATGTGALVTDRPIRLMDTCYVKDSSDLDTTLKILSRQEYNQLGLKATSSTVSQVFYDPQLTNGVLKVYGTPSDSTHTAYLTAQTPVYDMNSNSETLDMPQEGYMAVVFGLSDYLLDEYPVKADKASRITQKAEYYRNQLADFSQEESSVFFQPTMRGK
jgi:hypothetical protein